MHSRRQGYKDTPDEAEGLSRIRDVTLPVTPARTQSMEERHRGIRDLEQSILDRQTERLCFGVAGFHRQITRQASIRQFGASDTPHLQTIAT